MDNKEIMAKLAAPFRPQEIEWRIGQAGKTKQGEIWCKVLAYLTARGVMDRLDEVVGPENWRSVFDKPPNDPKGESSLCTLCLRIGGEWIGKSDAASNSDIEPVKGGISDSLKRAAVHWGIGRYLYDLTDTWGQVVEKKEPGAHYANCKIKVDGKEEWVSFWWLPPKLPEWAMPPMAKVPEDSAKEKNTTTTTTVPEGEDKGQGGEITTKAKVLSHIRNMLVIGDAGKIRKRVIELRAENKLTDAELEEVEKALVDRLGVLAKEKGRKKTAA